MLVCLQFECTFTKWTVVVKRLTMKIIIWMVLKLSVTEVLQCPVLGKQTKCFGSVFRKVDSRKLYLGFEIETSSAAIFLKILT